MPYRESITVYLRKLALLFLLHCLATWISDVELTNEAYDKCKQLIQELVHSNLTSIHALGF
jgi:hypothetical protein